MSKNLPLTGLITALAVIFIVAASAAAVSVLGAVSQIPVPTAGLPATQNAGTAATADAAQIPAPPFAAEVEARIKSADPSKGAALYSQYGCAACHAVENSTGPYVVGTGSRAATRRPGYSAAAYIYESITDPTAFTVPGYPAGVMPQNFKERLPEADLYNLIAWLLTQ